jgi:hypothetical protein
MQSELQSDLQSERVQSELSVHRVQNQRVQSEICGRAERLGLAGAATVYLASPICGARALFRCKIDNLVLET